MLKLEVGKKYRNRVGEIITIESDVDLDAGEYDYRFRGDDFFMYTASGSFTSGLNPDEYVKDLIEEVHDTLTEEIIEEVTEKFENSDIPDHVYREELLEDDEKYYGIRPAVSVINEEFDKSLSEHLEITEDSSFSKFDSGKPTFDFISGLTEEISKVNAVMAYGANKYAKDNWKKGNSQEDIIRYKNAAIRHLMASLNGEEVDEESGLNHLAHAATNCLFLLYLTKEA